MLIAEPLMRHARDVREKQLRLKRCNSSRRTRADSARGSSPEPITSPWFEGAPHAIAAF
jgi:hypothetical protein